MSYNPRQRQTLIDERLKGLNKKLTICRDVKATIDSKGWKNTIAPILDKMIIDILGGKIGDTWISGKLDRAKTDEKREFYIGAKQALIEFHQHIIRHLEQIAVLEKDLEKIEADKNSPDKMPLEETRYAA